LVEVIFCYGAKYTLLLRCEAHLWVKRNTWNFRDYNNKYTSRSRRIRSGTGVQEILFCCQKS